MSKMCEKISQFKKLLGWIREPRAALDKQLGRMRPASRHFDKLALNDAPWATLINKLEWYKYLQMMNKISIWLNFIVSSFL